MISKKFFPKNIFDKNDEEDDYKQRLYAGHLLAMNEYPIYDTDSSDLTIYRFLYLQSFKIPIMIKVDVKKNENNLKAIIPSGAYSIREKEISKTLNEKETQEIEKYIEKMDFWNLNTSDGRRRGLDGSQSIFEVYDKSNKYHVIERYNPGSHFLENQYYVELINYLLNLADKNTPKVYTGDKVKTMAKKLDEKLQGDG